MMSGDCKNIFELLRGKRFILSDEKKLQLELANIFNEEGIKFIREMPLDEKGEDIIDFLLEVGIGIEIKIKCNKRAMYRQLLRYSNSPKIEQIILITATNTGMPNSLEGKPVFILNISKAWL